MTMEMITTGSAVDAETIADLRNLLAAAGHREDDLKLEVARADNRIVALIREKSEAERQHREDVATIGTRLLSEAGRRDWCGEYDAVVEELNNDLYVELPVRKRTYTVSIDVRVDIEVEATDEDDARSRAYDIAQVAERRVDSTEGVSTSQWDSSYDYRIDDED